MKTLLKPREVHVTLRSSGTRDLLIWLKPMAGTTLLGILGNTWLKPCLIHVLPERRLIHVLVTFLGHNPLVAEKYLLSLKEFGVSSYPQIPLDEKEST